MPLAKVKRTTMRRQTSPASTETQNSLQPNFTWPFEADDDPEVVNMKEKVCAAS